MARVVLAMSGGVDSSVAAELLRRQGHEVVGVFMRHGASSPVLGKACAATGEEREAATSPLGVAEGERGRHAAASTLPLLNPGRVHKQGCCSAADAEDARRVADRLDIPFYALNLEQEFSAIIDYFVLEYAAGRTPNPCVVCNTRIKFGKLFEYADGIGAEFVATGHYARRIGGAGGSPPQLCRGADRAKDQSYALFGIARERLPRMLLPVGEYRKPEIRALAGELGLRVAAKRDSQEICFVPEGEHAAFVRDRLPASRDTCGEIVTTDGHVVGRHDGIEAFTVGQRKGLGVALGEPYFVVRIEPETRRVVIGRREELNGSRLTAAGTNWLVDLPAGPFRCQVQIRYNAPATSATARVVDGGRLEVAFDEPRFGVAPGQAVVCYDGDRVLGGGWIE